MSLINTLGVKKIFSPSTGIPLKSHGGLLLPGNPKFSHTKQSGSIIIGGVEVAMTHQCCHCSAHWIPIEGSKKIRGFCKNCGQRHCGAPKCWSCVPHEKQMEIIEKEFAITVRL